ncbi:MAG: acylphosphatase [Promethearchaeota archaeon]
MKKRLRLTVYGRVQGVFFRACTRDIIHEIGDITGYVRNCHDGSVEIVAEGEIDKLEQLQKWVKQGKTGHTPYSRVDKVMEQWESWKGEFQSFNVTFRY